MARPVDGPRSEKAIDERRPDRETEAQGAVWRWKIVPTYVSSQPPPMALAALLPSVWALGGRRREGERVGSVPWEETHDP